MEQRTSRLRLLNDTFGDWESMKLVNLTERYTLHACSILTFISLMISTDFKIDSQSIFEIDFVSQTLLEILRNINTVHLFW